MSAEPLVRPGSTRHHSKVMISTDPIHHSQEDQRPYVLIEPDPVPDPVAVVGHFPAAKILCSSAGHGQVQSLKFKHGLPPASGLLEARFSLGGLVLTFCLSQVCHALTAVAVQMPPQASQPAATKGPVLLGLSC